MLGPAAKNAQQSVAWAGYAATLPASGVTLRGIGGGPVATGSIQSSPIKDTFDGHFCIPPNSYISLQAFTTAISVVASIVWAELPI
jgi:hypothetical protein